MQMTNELRKLSEKVGIAMDRSGCTNEEKIILLPCIISKLYIDLLNVAKNEYKLELPVIRLSLTKYISLISDKVAEILGVLLDITQGQFDYNPEDLKECLSIHKGQEDEVLEFMSLLNTLKQPDASNSHENGV